MPPLGGLLGELAGIETELHQQLRVLFVVDLVWQVLHGFLDLGALARLLEFSEHELLIELHGRSPFADVNGRGTPRAIIRTRANPMEGHLRSDSAGI
jgi:hypothetical protein